MMSKLKPRGYDTDTPDQLEELLNDVFEGFISDIQDDPRFVIPVGEYDGPVDESWQYVYTARGMRLIENMQRRLGKIFDRHFPDKECTIESYLYQEL